MKQAAAPASLSIIFVTGFVMVLTLVLFISAVFTLVLIWAAVFLLAVVGICYLYAPVAYEIEQGRLSVIRRINTRTFSPVIKCTSIAQDKPTFGIRLWGNGGVFSGSGIYWNKRYGIFRAYVTTGKRDTMLLVETPTDKVIISPARPELFL